MTAAVVTVLAPRLKAVVALLATGTIVVVLFITLAIANSVGRSEPESGFPHAQLEADRIMTEQMATAVGSGMRSVMTVDGMVERSRDPAYLRALEQHVYEVDRMLGRVP